MCRCRLAWLPPSALWLFEPRSPFHDKGAWYVEVDESVEGGQVPLPALLLFLAYKTLDAEGCKGD